MTELPDPTTQRPAPGSLTFRAPRRAKPPTHLADLDQVLGSGFAASVVEGTASRWKDGSPYAFPGRGKLQPILMRRASRVFLAGDYLGTLYTESAITTGFSAAQEAVSLLATDRQRS